ncbi:MAG: transmembrane 220 family protein [Methylococcaceae bacterium]
MKILNYILAFIFVLFALVQYNDPDPWFWIPVYGSVAAIAFFTAQHHFYKIPMAITLVICLIGSIYFFPGVVELFSEHEAGDLANKMKADQTYIEEARESLGLLMAVASLAFNYWQIVSWDEHTAKTTR